jgi:hypothetical protein
VSYDPVRGARGQISHPEKSYVHLRGFRGAGHIVGKRHRRRIERRIRRLRQQPVAHVIAIRRGLPVEVRPGHKIPVGVVTVAFDLFALDDDSKRVENGCN